MPTRIFATGEVRASPACRFPTPLFLPPVPEGDPPGGFINVDFVSKRNRRRAESVSFDGDRNTRDTVGFVFCGAAGGVFGAAFRFVPLALVVDGGVVAIGRIITCRFLARTIRDVVAFDARAA